MQIAQTHLCNMIIFITVYRKQRISKSGDAEYLANIFGRGRSFDVIIHDVKPIYAKRKEMIEHVLADAKEKHSMRWTTLRGLKKIVHADDSCFRCN